ncbi:hypothetical protein INS49_007240 [Diaporthe citri]|uniref:uncharacterized protein n=1 Tax=Diaporthe citri TaxID=83186 RepID=UPI001C827F17|nr:uncharacterized protein INS49_007240 [Diaporthe citri]KAG6365629.1 hypothetical protein INS49_007240 [Diaporthe citri]
MFANANGIQAMRDRRADGVEWRDMVSYSDSHGRMPLHWAAGGLEAKVTPDDILRTMGLLLGDNAAETVSAPDAQGDTPLHYAVRSSVGGAPEISYQVARFLCGKGARAGTRGTKRQTPLHCLVSAHAERPSSSMMALCKLLLAHSADVGDADADGNTVLHLAARSAQHLETVRFFLDEAGTGDEKGAQDLLIRAVNAQGDAPLHMAAAQNHFARDQSVEERIRSQDEMMRALTPESRAHGEDDSEQSLLDQANQAGKTPRQICDQCWPSATDWDSFNQTLGGKLIRTVPIASPCHDTFPGVSYDALTCADIQANWVRPTLHDVTSHSPMAPIFANESCDPFTGREAQCIIGSYVQYIVNATGASDYIATLDFARKRNIRLIIRNTGHDYLGKSTGAGAIALWTHHLKDIAVLDYSSTAYTGKAVKMGAGVQAAEAQAVANAAGLVVVEGDCPTVGLAGGYTQGGGTGPLGSKFGLAADQVLEWEVVTPTGKTLTATPDQNSDLYWALSGGGGGTYGIVLSMTVKLHQDMPTGGATLSFTESSDKF